MEEKRAQKIGEMLIDVLGLKVKKNGRVDTSAGDKTPIGLARTIERVIDENAPVVFKTSE